MDTFWNRQLVLGGRKNKALSVNTRSDDRDTFKSQILEFRPGNIKFLFCHQAGDKVREVVSSLRVGSSGTVKTDSTCPTRRGQLLSSSSLLLVSGNVDPDYCTFQLCKCNWKCEFLWKLKKEDVNTGGRFLLSKQEGMESKQRDILHCNWKNKGNEFQKVSLSSRLGPVY